MQQLIIEFPIALPLERGCKIKHIVNKSFYDHNYYELPGYGDWLMYGRDNNNILFVEYDEFSNAYTYSFGHFEDGKYVKALSFGTQKDILEGVEIEQTN